MLEIVLIMSSRYLFHEQSELLKKYSYIIGISAKNYDVEFFKNVKTIKTRIRVEFLIGI